MQGELRYEIINSLVSFLTEKEISSIGRATVLHTEGWVFESPIS